MNKSTCAIIQLNQAQPLNFWGQLTLLTGETGLSFSVIVVVLYWPLIFDGSIKSSDAFYSNIFYHGA